MADILRTLQQSFAVYVCTVAVFIQMNAVHMADVLSYACIAAIAPLAAFGVLLALALLLLWIWSQIASPERPSPQSSDHLVLHDKSIASRYKNKTIPIQEAIELYTNQKMDFKHDLYTILREHRHQLFRFNFTWFHARFVLAKLVPQALNHSKAMDGGEVKQVYNRGNDFYNWFLGDSMVYTSGIYTDKDGSDSLEAAQTRKMESLCQKLQLKEGDSLLDIGCGWGTLTRYAAKEHRAKVLGITICQEQVNWANEGIDKDGTKDLAEVRLLDYRDIPKGQKFDKIVCVEMAEHVGILRFQAFLRLVRDHLKDDGIFVLQIAGLRRAWQFEDLIWGVYMGTYVFPAADASCPLGWVTNQLEGAGFEVWTTQNIGIHYSRTLKQWYDNWCGNRDAVVAKYGEWWFRQWCVFLAWSSIIASQGSSTCWQIAMHKNIDALDRKRYINHKCYGIVAE